MEQASFDPFRSLSPNEADDTSLLAPILDRDAAEELIVGVWNDAS
jgi:hypothetical protein